MEPMVSDLPHEHFIGKANFDAEIFKFDR